MALKTHHSLLIVFLLLGSVVGSTIGEVAASLPSSGYITRLNVEPAYTSDEDIHIEILAYFSVDGRYTREPVLVEIQTALDSVEAQMNGTKLTYETGRNITLDDSRLHRVNIGRLSQGTYRIRVVFHTANGEIIKENSMAIMHPPVMYSIALCGGDMVDFRSEEENETFTIKLIIQYSFENIEEIVKHNVTNYTWERAGRKPQQLNVYVVDQYGNENAHNENEVYEYDYNEDDFIGRWKVVIFSVLILAFAVASVLLIRRTKA